MGRHGVAETLTGAVVLLAALGFLAYAVSHSGRVTATGYPLQAVFDHIDGLNVGGDVRIAGVKVGTVTDERINPKTFSAIVTMTVRDDLHLSTDTGASIVSESLLGGKYISLSPGGEDANLKPGQTITATQSSVSLEELLGKFIFSATSLNGAKDGQPGGSNQSGNNQSGGKAADGNRGGGALPPLGK